MRRVAKLLADLLVQYGAEATVEPTLTGRSRMEHRLPLAARFGNRLVLVDGTPTEAVDEAAVHRLVMAATDLGCRQALFLHDGPVSAVALDAAQERVWFWPRDRLVALLGEALWASATDQPLPTLPAPLADLPTPTTPAVVPAPPVTAPTPPAPVATSETVASPIVAAPTPAPTPPATTEPETTDDDFAVAAPDPTVIELPDTLPEASVDATEPERTTITLAEPDTLRDQEFLDLGGSHLGDDSDEPQGGTLPDLLLAPVVEPMPEPPVQPTAPVTTPVRAPGMAALVAAADIEPPLFALPQAFREPEPEIPGETLSAPDGSQGLLPPRITLDEATTQVRGRLFGIEDAELILQPVHLFDYAVDLLREGSLTMDTVKGRLQVNGTDRRVLTTDPTRSDPALPHRVFAASDLTVMDKVCRVSPERARQVAHDWATAQYAKTIELDTAGADDSFELLEKRQVAPTSSQVTLSYLGLWHRPFWRLWGNNGHIDLDAVEGQVLDEEVRGPDPDILVVE